MPEHARPSAAHLALSGLVCGLARQAGLALIGVMLGLAPLAALAGTERMDRLGPFAFQSDGASQLGTPYTVDVRTDGVLRIAYRAPHAHCSALRLHVSVDERVAAVSALVGPGQRSEVMDLGRRTPDVHSVSIQAEGIPGGCNTGNLHSWGGTFEIWTSGSNAGPYLPKFADPGEIFLEVERINTGDGVGRTGSHIGTDGVVRLYGTTRAQHFSPPPVSDDDVYGIDWLYAKYAVAAGATMSSFGRSVNADGFWAASVVFAAQWGANPGSLQISTCP
jgi:hypothetical protein